MREPANDCRKVGLMKLTGRFGGTFGEEGDARHVPSIALPSCARGRSPDVHQATTRYLCSFSIQYSGPCMRFQKVVVATPPTDSEDRKVAVTTAIVPHDSVPAGPSKRWPVSRLLVMPITHRVLQYAQLDGAECAPLTA
jgi:hypothetical protein